MDTTDDDAEQERAALRARMAEHLDAALAPLADIADPVARERAARILADDLLPDAAKRVKVVRGDAVRELRQTLTLAKVQERTGLSIPRIDQLAKGK
ncbi:hypothetical protein AB0I84_09355 [Streptomyces spectabilis]|uniref:hypothetical protein n=1 Tax=Streptomyces spectabilis TaxID=68270 RepID=UPI0033E3D0A6